MSLNETPQGERVHIALFGRRNVGKSSLINTLTGQEVSIVSAVKGTTTDPVRKAMELPPLGPIMIFDTPGLDDEGALGDLRMQRTHEILNKTDVAVLVLETEHNIGTCEQEILELVRAKKIPLVVVYNKTDLSTPSEEAMRQVAAATKAPLLTVSSVTGQGIENLKLTLAKIIPDDNSGPRLIADLLQPLDVVVLVTPIDSAAPKGRLILPQQQTVRDILDAGALAFVTKDTGLIATLDALKQPPRLVITDSQVFAKVSAETPRNVPLTSFSILFARYKGDLEILTQGAHAVDKLKDGDHVLIAEGCTHHRQCDDIGTVKIPRWLSKHTGGKELSLEHTSGIKYPRDLSKYSLIIHCGACMLNRREMHYRIAQAQAAGVPIVNYGVFIAHVTGILERCLEPFGASDPAWRADAQQP